MWKNTNFENFLLTEAQPRSIDTLGDAILNLSGQIDILFPEGPVIICLLYPRIFYLEKNKDNSIINTFHSML